MLVLSQEEPSRTWLPSEVDRDDAHARSAIEYLIAQSSAWRRVSRPPASSLWRAHRNTTASCPILCAGSPGFAHQRDEMAVKEWIAKAWPFKNAAFPGRDIAWETWKATPDE